MISLAGAAPPEKRQGDVPLRFRGLDLEGYALDALSIKGNSKATVVLSRLRGELAETYELQFNGLERATLDVAGGPWFGEVLGHRVAERSLRCEPDGDDRPPPPNSPEILLEFALTVTAGCITFVARDFVLSPVRGSPATG